MTAGGPTAEPRPVFVVGSQRSGTSAFTAYLNLHPEILICRERFGLIPAEVTPELFTFDRILDFRPGETVASRDRHVRLLAAKDPARLRWLGDKNPGYVRHLSTLDRNNPGALFFALFRRVEEVAESFEARASDPEDRWPSDNGFEAGIEVWNTALREIRRFVTRNPRANLVVVDYERFFSDPDSLIPLLAWRLELDLDARLRGRWAARSSDFSQRRRAKAPLTDERRALVAARRDARAEAWVRNYMERQERERFPIDGPAARLRAAPRRALAALRR